MIQTTMDRVLYVGHATVLLELGGVRLLTDPMLRGRLGHLRRHGAPPDPSVAEEIDAVLISHMHFDHLDLPSLRRLGAGTRLIVSRGAGHFLERKGFTNVVELGVGDAVELRDARVTAVAAKHEGRRHAFASPVETVGYRVSASREVYFVGDTELHPGMSESAGGLDLALLPVWGWGPALGPGHLDPGEAARAAALLRPRLAVPIHWGTLFPVGLARWRGRLLRDPPREFAARASELAPDVDVRVLEPGEWLDLPG